MGPVVKGTKKFEGTHTVSDILGVQSWKDVIRGKRKTHAWSCEHIKKTARKEAGKPSLHCF